MKKNAIILAAGRSNRFAPFTYEKPKGLFRIKKQVLIERQIEQLLEAGVKEIYIVVGFMKEKFFYLEQKYKEVNLIINNTYGIHKGNLYSLFCAKEYLSNSYICCADHYFIINPFIEEEMNSYRAIEYRKERFREFAVTVSNADVITSLKVGGEDSWIMAGHAYFDQEFSRVFVKLMEAEINNFGIADMFWEEFYGSHQKELTLYAKRYYNKEILEFESVEDLKNFDQDFLMNIDSFIVSNICSILKCDPNDILNIEVIQKGLTNVNFKFMVNNIYYVYRHPGGTSANLVNRETEVWAQEKAKEIGIDRSVIYIDLAGWKLSYYIEDIIPCDFENTKHLKKVMNDLRVLHRINRKEWEGKIKVFDTYKEAMHLLNLASASKGDLNTEFSDLISKVSKLNDYLTLDGFEKVWCHNDTYEPNFLITEKDEFYLIDWEYSGINDSAHDLGSILSRRNLSESEIKKILEEYFERELTPKEYQHYTAYIVLSGFYWFCWGLYKGSVGDDDGFFFLPAYRNCIRLVDRALQSYERKN